MLFGAKGASGSTVYLQAVELEVDFGCKNMMSQNSESQAFLHRKNIESYMDSC